MTHRDGGHEDADEQGTPASERRTEKVDVNAWRTDPRAEQPSADVPDDPTPPSGTPAAGESERETAVVSTGGGAPEGGRPRGSVRYQDPDSTKPREPTVAEQRARREAQRRERAQAEAAAAAEERKRKVRKRVLVGGGVAVGVVALVAIVYAASSPDEVEAQCVDPNGVVVPDENCTSGTQQGGYYDSGGHFVPIFIGGFGGTQYHYNYGSNSPVGTVARGGSTAPPSSGTTVRSGTSGSTLGTSGGSSGTVSRGGLGVGGSSSGSSGSSSGSSGSSGSSSSGSGSSSSGS